MKDIIINLTTGINEALRYVKQKIEEKTPEDTKRLVGSYKIQEAKQTGNIISGKVYNNTPYAYYVEYGVGGKIYKYNKPKGNIFKLGVGARMITQTKEEETGNITQIIKSKLGTK